MSENHDEKQGSINAHDGNQLSNDDLHKGRPSLTANLKRKRSFHALNTICGQKHSDSESKRRKRDNSHSSLICGVSVTAIPSCSEENCFESSKLKSDDLIQFIQEELTCNICSELFINPVTLNCSHSFCEFCISKWRTEKSTCPICRKEITSRNFSLILDRFIEKMLALQTEETRKHREKLIELREKHKKHETDPSDKDNEQLVNDFLCWFGISEFMEIFDERNLDEDPQATNYDHNDNCTIN